MSSSSRPGGSEWGEEDSCVTAQSWGWVGLPGGRGGSAAEEGIYGGGSNAGAPAASGGGRYGNYGWMDGVGLLLFSTRVRVSRFFNPRSRFVLDSKM